MKTALLASLIAGLATGLGALPLLIWKSIPHRIYDGLLGLSGGIMIAASFIALIVPAIEAGGIVQAILGVIIGAVLIIILDRILPHMEPHFSQEFQGVEGRRAILLALAIALHNFPEGLAVGISFLGGNETAGWLMAIVIAIQNIPEGLAVAAPLRAAGAGKAKGLFWATLSGIVEPLAVLVSFLFVSVSQGIYPFSLAFAGGAMLYVTLDELIPESHGHGNKLEANWGVVTGVIIFLIIENLMV